jgi:hypothetical protein
VVINATSDFLVSTLRVVFIFLIIKFQNVPTNKHYYILTILGGATSPQTEATGDVPEEGFDIGQYIDEELRFSRNPYYE